MMHGASTQTVDKIKFSKSILTPSSPAVAGFFVCGMMGRFIITIVLNNYSNYIRVSQIGKKMRIILIFSIVLSFCIAQTNSTKETYLGKLSNNKYGTNSTSNQYGTYGSKYSPNSVNNQYGTYGSKYSPKSATNPYATNTPKLYDSKGNYRGKLSTNKYDPESISNPYGKYGSKYSSESINNPYGAGSKYKKDSPNNPYGTGLYIISPD